MSVLISNKLYYHNDPGRHNHRVMVGDNFVNYVYMADELNQILLQFTPNQKGGIKKEHGESCIRRNRVPFEIKDVRTGYGINKNSVRVNKLYGQGTGKRCFVLGSGPSLEKNLSMIKPDDLVISINYRPLELIVPDYVVLVDRLVYKKVAHYYTDRLVTWWGDMTNYQLDWHDTNYWNHPHSSCLAIWLACYLGCKDVILLGFDCYRGEEIYIGHEKSENPACKYPLESFYRLYLQAFQYCLNPQRISVVDSPLSCIFKEYR